jgi:hypothetical protein
MQDIDGRKEDSGYEPHRLLDVLCRNYLLKNDADLARFLEVSAPIICKVRSRTLPVSAALLIRMHEATGLAIEDLRYLMGDQRSKFRLSRKRWERVTERTGTNKAGRSVGENSVPRRPSAARAVRAPSAKQLANAVLPIPESSVPQSVTSVRPARETSARKQTNATWPVPDASAPTKPKKIYKPTTRRW